MTYAARFTRATAIDLAPGQSPSALPMGGLVINPGHYSFNGAAYDCTNEGLHRWLVPLSETVNRIVWQNDPYAFLSGLCWLATHGRADEALSVSERTLKARTGSKLALRCGPLVEWVRYVTGGNGLTTRQVHLLTCEDPTGQPWENVDTGHIALEASIGGVWRFFDPTCNAYPTDNGVHLSAKDMVAPVAADTFAIESIAGDAAGSSEPFASGQFDCGAWCEMEFLRDGGVRRWMRRIYQAVGIPNGNEVWWKLPEGAEDRASWVESKGANWVVIDPTLWDATFYA